MKRLFIKTAIITKIVIIVLCLLAIYNEWTLFGIILTSFCLVVLATIRSMVMTDYREKQKKKEDDYAQSLNKN